VKSEELIEMSSDDLTLDDLLARRSKLMTHHEALAYPEGHFRLESDPNPNCTGQLSFQGTQFRDDVFWSLSECQACSAHIEVGGDRVTCFLVKVQAPARPKITQNNEGREGAR
jgi:hypothetical protein